MNARERAIKIAETSGQAGDLISFKTQAMIEQAIIAAEEAKAEKEREACVEIAKQIKEKELRRLDLETCCSNTAAEIEECIRARSEGEKKGD